MKQFFIALLAFAALSVAEPHTHDGFFMNYAVGAGYQNFEFKHIVGSKSASIEGVSSEFSLKLGRAINPEMIVHFTLFDVKNTNELSFDGESYPIEGVNSMFIGIGATHYTETNFFTSVSIGYTQTHFATEAQIDFRDKNHGFGFEASIGKEWWCGEEWGFGGAIALTYIRNPRKGYNASAYGINFMLSLTYN